MCLFPAFHTVNADGRCLKYSVWKCELRVQDSVISWSNCSRMEKKKKEKKKHRGRLSANVPRINNSWDGRNIAVQERRCNLNFQALDHTLVSMYCISNIYHITYDIYYLSKTQLLNKITLKNSLWCFCGWFVLCWGDVEASLGINWLIKYLMLISFSFARKEKVLKWIFQHIIN